MKPRNKELFNEQWVFDKSKSTAEEIIGIGGHRLVESIKAGDVEQFVKEVKRMLQSAFITAMHGTLMFQDQGADFSQVKEGEMYQKSKAKLTSDGTLKPISNIKLRSVAEIQMALYIFKEMLSLGGKPLREVDKMLAARQAELLLWIVGEDNDFGKFIDECKKGIEDYEESLASDEMGINE